MCISKISNLPLLDIKLPLHSETTVSPDHFFIQDQASDLWQQLELASEVESDLKETVGWGRKWLVDFNAGKTQLVSFNRSKNTGAIDVKWMGLFLKKNYLLRFWGWLALLNCIRALTLSLLLKLPPKKLEPSFVLWSFFLLRLLYI